MKVKGYGVIRASSRNFCFDHLRVRGSLRLGRFHCLIYRIMFDDIVTVIIALGLILRTINHVCTLVRLGTLVTTHRSRSVHEVEIFAHLQTCLMN